MPHAGTIIPVINKLKASEKFDYIFLTRDWHPENHISFGVNNPGSELFKPILLEKTKVQ